MEKKRLIIGPSHIMRWLQSIDVGIVPLPKNVDFYGRGGAPIWGDFIQSKKKDFGKYDEIVFIVGDFRFGNKTLHDNSQVINQHGIDKQSISNENDIVMYQRVVNELTFLSNSVYSEKLKFVFWDLALREYKNRKENKYTVNGEYLHPVWNLNQLQNKFEKNTIKIDIKKNLESLFIDSSNHPSFLGYVCLYNLILGFKNNISTIDLFPPLKLSKYKIIGDSSLIRNVNAFCSKGILDSSYSLETVTLSKLEVYLKHNLGNIVFVSNIRQWKGNEVIFSQRVKKLFNIKKKFSSRFKVIFWDSFAQEVISTRKESYNNFLPDNPLFRHSSLISSFENNVEIYPSKSSMSAQSMVELNTGLQPTIKAVLWLFMCNEYSLREFEEYYSAFRQSYFDNPLTKNNE